MKESIEIRLGIKHLEFFKYKPLALTRVLKGYFKKNFLRQDVLRTVDLAITGLCHYKCIFCSASRLYRKGGPFLTVKQIKDIWQQCVELGAVHVNLTGGEPLLRDMDEICQIIRNFDPRYFLISLVSNGLEVTKNKLFLLKNAGLDTLQLSIESTDPQKHDILVGINGSFNKVMEAINYARELRLNVCLNAVFFSDNADEIESLINFAKNKNVFLVLNTASAEGKTKEVGAKKLQEKDKAIFEHFMRFSNVRHDSSLNFSGRRECPGGKERIHITAYGDVLTCPLVQISYGNVLEEPLKNIYKRMNNISYLRSHSRMCKHAFNETYYKDLLLPIEKEEKRPVSIFNHPTLKGKNNE